MAKRTFLPGINTASGSNRVLVTMQDLPERMPQLGASQRADLLGKRVIAYALRHKPEVSGLIAAPVPEPGSSVTERWSALSYVTKEWVTAHLAQTRIPNYHPSKFATENAARDHVIHAARDGVATCGAIIEVVPRTLFSHDFTRPNEDIEQWAERTLGMAMEWMGVDSHVDPQLAWSLRRYPKPKPGKSPFTDLHFDDRQFVADNTARTVVLDPLQVPHLRGSDTHTPPMQGQRAPEELYGCPARKWIPDIYLAMTSLAANMGLFAATYHEQRANHGYSEYH